MNYGEATWWHNGNGSGKHGRLTSKDTSETLFLAILTVGIISGIIWIIWKILKWIVLFIYNLYFPKKKKSQKKKQKKYVHKRTGSYNDYPIKK